MSSASFSLKSRLLLWAFFLIPLTLIITGISVTDKFSENAENQFTETLSVYLRQLLARLDARDGVPMLSGTLNDPRFNQPYSKLYWQINQDNKPIFRSPSLVSYVLPLPTDMPEDGKIYSYPIVGPQNQQLVLLECKVSLGNVEVIAAIAADHTDVDRAISRFSKAVILVFFMLGLVLLLIVIFQVWGGLRPLKILHEKLRDISSGKATHIEGQFPAEIQPMVDELNALILGNTEILERSRMQAANLAHGLKTPLAILTALINKKDTQPRGRYEQAKISNQIKIIQRQIDYTLARARAALSADIINTQCNVSKKLEEIVYAFDVLYKEKALKISYDIKPNLYVKIEAQDFDEIVGNILDNACKWAKSQIIMSFIPQDRWLKIIIDDDGPGLSPAQRKMVFTRGSRLDDSTPGSGLGLSIVQDLVQSYRGEVKLEDSSLGGLRVILILPTIELLSNPH